MKERIGLGLDYLWCSLYACAAFAIELLLVFVEGKFESTMATSFIGF